MRLSLTECSRDKLLEWKMIFISQRIQRRISKITSKSRVWNNPIDECTRCDSAVADEGDVAETAIWDMAAATAGSDEIAVGGKYDAGLSRMNSR